jgi:tRNA pseudouridine-54 N-methylase
MTEFPEMSRQKIDEGTLNRDALTLVNCVRSALFTSYGLRRNSNLILYSLDRSEEQIRIEGNKLRYMGPNERSISILLSMSVKKLFSEDLEENSVSSPGMTIIKKDFVLSIRGIENSLFLYQSREGLDLRTVEFTEKTVFICKLNPEISLEGITHMFGTDARNILQVKSEDTAENAILLTNNEIDRKHS